MKKIKKIFKNKKGFTLIELIVVIAVLGMIAAIAIPKVADITGKAKTNADKQTVTILNEAVERYRAYNGSLPAGSDAKDVITELKSSSNGGPYLGSDIKTPAADAGVALPSGDVSKYSSGVFGDPE